MSTGKPSHELDIGEILYLTFSLYFSRFLQFFLPFLVSGTIVGLSAYAITSSFPLPTPPRARSPFEEFSAWLYVFLSRLIVIGISLGLISWIVATLAIGVVVKCASDQIERGTSSLSVGFDFTLSKFQSLLAAQLIVGILSGVGLLLFYVPGIIVQIMFSLAIPVMVVEKGGALQSLGRSRRLVRNRWLKTFALLLIFGIISGIVGLLAMPFVFVYPNIVLLVTSVVSAFVAPVHPIAVTYLYYAMVAREVPPPPPPPFTPNP